MEVQEQAQAQEQASFIFGYIYRISNNFHCYYGSTFKPLHLRLKQHQQSYQAWITGKSRQFSTSFVLLDENVKIELMESHQDISKTDLLLIEKRYITEYPCVNRNRPIITREERLQSGRDYYRKHWQSINDRKNEQICCDKCGSFVSRTNITHHEKSKNVI
jgi:hypothetical protein